MKPTRRGCLIAPCIGAGRLPTHGDPREGHTKVLSGTKKERNQWVFFVVKGIIGQRYYESDFWPDLAR